MPRFEGYASIRRALSMPNGNAQLDIKPDGLNWQPCYVSPERARQALACGLAAICGGFKLYVTLPDDPNSNVLEVIGLTKTVDRPEAIVAYQGAPGKGIGGYDLASPADRVFAFDYNSNGRLDHLVLYQPGSGAIWILRNNAGTFTPVYKTYPLGDPVFGGDPIIGIGGYDLLSPADRVFAFDYNSSGRLDHLVLYRPGAGTIWILRNNAGTFTKVYQGTGIGGYDLLSPADRVFAFDYNSSGRLDHLVLYRPGTGTIFILRNTAGTFTQIYRGVGIGNYDLFSPADRAFAFDYNNVGRLDHLVLCRPGTGTIWILKNSAGTFTPVYQGTGIRDYDLRDPRDRAFAFDYNSNGRLDNLVLYRPGTGNIWILNSLN